MRIAKAILLILIFQIPVLLLGQTDEYLIKAGLIEKFSKFTEWPDMNSTSTFEIAVIGKSPFGEVLDQYYMSKHIKGKPVQIKYITSISDAHNSQVLFICNTEAYRLNKILAEVAHMPILTVSEHIGFAKAGVIVNFYNTKQQTIHFEMNTESIKKSTLKIDIMLMNYAVLVK